MPLTLVITDAGRAALVNAAHDGTRAVRIASAGVSPNAVVASRAATALPGEIKRIASLAGDHVAADTIHLIIQDETDATYSLRSFALYLADGTLFALYGQAAPIIEKSAQAVKGVTDTDFAERLNDSAEQTKKLKINAMALAIGMGGLLLPMVNAVTGKLATFATWVSGVAQRHPLLAKAVGIGALALAGLFLVLGGGAIALAGIMMPIAIVNSGLIAMGVAGGVASIGLLPIIGTVALVVAGIALLAGSAYLLYKNWGAVSSFFSSLWAGVKAVFSMSLFDIVKGMASFVGYALGALYRFGPAAWAWLTGTLPGLLDRGWAMAWQGFKSAIYTAFVAVPKLFANLGVMIVQGLWNGIKSAPGRLWNAGKQLFSSLAGGFKAGAQIRSPSRVFMALGGHVIGGLNAGLDRGHAGAVGRMKRLVGNMAAAAALPAMGPAEAYAARAGNIRVYDSAPAARGTSASSSGGIAAGGGITGGGTVNHITINAAPGMDAGAIARAVAEELDRRDRAAARATRSTMTDPPDWTV